MNRKQRRAAEKLLKRQSKEASKPPPAAWWSIDSKDQLTLQLIPHSCLDNFRKGCVQEGDFDTLAMRVNWCKTVCQRFAHEHLPTAEAGIVAMLAVKDRYQRLGRWGMTGPEMTAVGNALNAIDDMQTQLKRVELIATMRDVFRLAAE